MPCANKHVYKSPKAHHTTIEKNINNSRFSVEKNRENSERVLANVYCYKAAARNAKQGEFKLAENLLCSASSIFKFWMKVYAKGSHCPKKNGVLSSYPNASKPRGSY